MRTPTLVRDGPSNRNDLPIHFDKGIGILLFFGKYVKYLWVFSVSHLPFKAEAPRPKLSHFQFTRGRGDQSCLTDVNDENNPLLYPKLLRTENTAI